MSIFDTGWSMATQCIHNDRLREAEHHGVHEPICSSIQFGFKSAEAIIDVFQGRSTSFSYARQGNPTVSALESSISRMEASPRTICFASGMAAIQSIISTLLISSDHLIASKFLFGNTMSLLETANKLGIDVSLVDATDYRNVESAIRDTTKMVFVESLANPKTQICDLKRIGELCANAGLVYVVDNTMASPWIYQPVTDKASLVVNSLSKIIGGHGNALGGAVTDTGLFNWEGFQNINVLYRRGDPKTWGYTQIRKKGLRDQGAALSAEAASKILVGTETYCLRIERACTNAETIARLLREHPMVESVFYPGLEEHPQHSLAKASFRKNGWLMSFSLRDPSQTRDFINQLKLPIISTGLGDTRTLILPVAETIYWEMGAVARKESGISDGLIRLSIGIEDISNLTKDIERAFRGVSDQSARAHVNTEMDTSVDRQALDISMFL